MSESGRCVDPGRELLLRLKWAEARGHFGKKMRQSELGIGKPSKMWKADRRDRRDNLETVATKEMGNVSGWR